MRDLIERLHNTKMILTGLILVVVGITLLLIGNVATGETEATAVELIPWNEFGGILIGGGILGIWIDQLFRRDQQAASEQQLRRVMHDHAPVMRDAVLEAFAADQKDLQRIASPELLDQIITNSLGLRLGDNQFASEVYSDIKAQTIDIQERWSDVNVDINVVPHESAEGYFSVVTRWEYTVVPKHHVRRFACVGDRREYADIARARSGTSAWYFKPDEQFAAKDEEAFRLLAFTIDGQEQSIKRSTRKGYQDYTVAIDAEIIEAGEPVVIAYTTRTVTRVNGNLLFFEIEQPTNGLSVSFDYTGTNIATVSAVDLVQSLRPSRIEHTPKQVQPKTLRVEIGGWTFPRSGVAFVWALH